MGQQELPLESGRFHVRVFQSMGWVVVRSKKNHFILTHHNKPNVLLSIPDHKEVRAERLKLN